MGLIGGATVYLKLFGSGGVALDLVWVKVHKQGGHVIVAICDEELLDKEFKCRDVTIKIAGSFYGGFKTSIEEALRLVKEATMVNLMGTRVIEAAIKKGFIHREAVVKLASTPHAMFFKI